MIVRIAPKYLSRGRHQPRAVKCTGTLDDGPSQTNQELVHQVQAHRASIGFFANLAQVVYELAVSRTLMSAHVG